MEGYFESGLTFVIHAHVTGEYFVFFSEIRSQIAFRSTAQGRVDVGCCVRGYLNLHHSVCPSRD